MGDFLDAHFTSPQRQARVKQARKWYCARSACSSIARINVLVRAVAFIISYQSTKETTTVQCRQLSHKVTKKAIKAALKLCMHVTICYELNLRTCFQKKMSPSSNTLDSTRQLIIETLRPEVGQKKYRVVRKHDACQIRVMFSSGSS